jgi:hypothetical protein
MAVSDKMWVVLKIYAADGENGCIPIPTENHTFVVLKGEAKFYGPNRETRTIGKNEGVLLPHGTFYWFKSDERRITGDGAYRRRCVRRGRSSRPH